MPNWRRTRRRTHLQNERQDGKTEIEKEHRKKGDDALFDEVIVIAAEHLETDATQRVG